MRTVPAGCVPLLILGLLVLVPFFLANAFLTALAKLGLGPVSSVVVAISIFIGDAFNVPVARIEQPEIVEYQSGRFLGLDRVLDPPVQRQTYTVIAVNVGGCLVPTALVGYPTV